MKKILVIEDNDAIRENTAEILELANYKVFTAGNGKTGIETAFRERPDLIICDIMMPLLDGYGVLHLLRNNPATRNTPLIFLTARSEKADMRMGMEQGADDYITKPFEETELLHAIESRLKKMEMIRQDLVANIQDGDGQVHASSDKDIMQLLVEDRDINKYKKGQIIYSEGNHPSRLYYIRTGKVKTYKTNSDGKDLIVGLHREGEFLGYVALFEGTTYKEMAEAMELSELVIIPKADFDLLINSDSYVARRFLHLMARNICEKEAHLLGLAYNSLRKKVAEALIMMSRKYNAAIDISRENLANMAGTATESLIRTLSDFRDEKIIDIRDGVITILDEQKLQKMLN